MAPVGMVAVVTELRNVFCKTGTSEPVFFASMPLET